MASWPPNERNCAEGGALSPETVLPLAHLTPYHRGLGGMQTMLNYHRAHDAEAGVNSRRVVFFDRAGGSEPGIDCLRWNWRSTIRGMRRDLGRWAERYPDRVAVYHNLWGLPFLAGVDRARRRVGFLHHHPPYLAEHLRAQRGWVDGMIAISQAQADLTRAQIPELTEERVCVVPLPIDPPEVAPPHPPLAGRPLVVGYCGRVVKEFKRVDRLPDLVRELDALGVTFRFEILGSGGEEAALRARWAGDARVVWHGTQSGEAYWRVLAGWDAAVNVSDSEALSLTVLEGLSVGVIPVFPRLPSGGVRYCESVDRSLVYPPGDMKAAAVALSRLTRLSPREWSAWRERGRQAIQGHLGPAYLGVFRSFLERLAAQPRLSGPRGPRPAWWTDWLPLGWIARMTPESLLRSG